MDEELEASVRGRITIQEESSEQNPKSRGGEPVLCGAVHVRSRAEPFWAAAIK
jgi:hypothetical protein